MTTFSVLLPFAPVRPENALPYAAFVRYRTPQRLWQGQTLVTEPHQMFAYLAAAGFRIPVGIGVTLMPLRHPLEAALQARSLAAMTGHPVVVGFGPGGAEAQASMLGRPYARPLAAVREYVTIVRALLTGQAVEHEGAYFVQQGGLPPLPGLTVELALGVLRPGMARLAGELADAAVTWLTPPSYLANSVVPALREGAARSRQTVPRVVVIVPVALRQLDRDPVELALASNRGHIQLPHYLDMLRRAGVGADPADPAATARGLLDVGAFCYGDPSQVVDLLDAYRAAGADEIVVNMTGVCQRYGALSALADLTTLFEELPADRREPQPLVATE